MLSWLHVDLVLMNVTYCTYVHSHFLEAGIHGLNPLAFCDLSFIGIRGIFCTAMVGVAGLAVHRGPSSLRAHAHTLTPMPVSCRGA
jgi:hypothetical protein